MIRKAFKIFKTPTFEKWFSQQTVKAKEQIRSRMSLIELNGYFGDHKSVSKDDVVWELRWKNGRRIYYSYLLEQNILLLIGGNKNGQNVDIKKARRIFEHTT